MYMPGDKMKKQYQDIIIKKKKKKEKHIVSGRP